MTIRFFSKSATHSEFSGDEALQEAAPTDYYWGVGRDGNGQNKLGLILMRIRAELKRTLP